MALLFTEGFDSYPNPIPLQYKWNRNSTATRVTGRSGGFACQPGHFNSLPKTITPNTTIITGFATFLTNNTTDYNIISVLNQFDQNCFQLSVNSSGILYVTDAANNVDTTGYSIQINKWSYIECKLTSAIQSAAAASLTIQITVDPASTATVVYTSPGGRNFNTFGHTQVATMVLNDQGDQYYDDIYICDTTGSFNNDFLGVLRIATLYPDANGATNQFTPVGAGTNYQAVNATQLSPDTTYVQDTTPGDKDLYQFQTLIPNSGESILGLTLNSVTEKTTSGYKQFSLPVVTAGEDDGSTYYAPSGYQSTQRCLDTDPATSLKWQLTTINTMQAGILI